jgi:single-stranded-DNA-specific exonuclease
VPDPRESLDLVALGTVADVAPLDGLNRILVTKGLEQIRRSSRPGLRALVRLADLEGKIPSSEEVAWRLAPRLNAPGRLGDAAAALECLYLRDEAQAAQRALECHRSNERRKEIQARMLDEAMAQARQRPDDSFCLVAAEGWHPGVIGIVAGRLADALGRPAGVVAREGPRGRASARSIPGLDLFELLRQCQSHLVRFGGHAAAAGFTVEVEGIEALRRALCEATDRAVVGLEPLPLQISDLLELEQVDHALCEGMRRLEPFGEGNRPPVFGAAGVRVERAREVGDGHLALTLRQRQAVRQAIGFGLADRRPGPDSEIDIAFVPEIDHYRGVDRPRLRLIELEAAGALRRAEMVPGEAERTRVRDE